MRGLAAGAIGTAAMTAYQTAVMKARESEASTVPAQVGKRIIEGVFHREVSDEAMGPLNNVAHILYGTSWGSIYGIAHGSKDGSPLRHGLTFWGRRLARELDRASGDEAGAPGLGVSGQRSSLGPLLSPGLRARLRCRLRRAQPLTSR